MSKIKITLPNNEVPITGKLISFVAPCDSVDAECIQIDGVDYAIVDIMGNPITGTNGIWCRNAIIAVILDTGNKKAYMQEAGVLPVSKGGTGATTIEGALANLGALRIESGTFKGNGYSTRTFTFTSTPKIFVLIGAEFPFIAINGASNEANRSVTDIVNRYPGNIHLECRATFSDKSVTVNFEEYEDDYSWLAANEEDEMYAYFALC
jgi:hypothetical protein